MQVKKLNKAQFIFKDPATGNTYKVTAKGMKVTPIYEINRHTREERFYFEQKLTVLEEQIVKMFLASKCRATIIGANTMITSIGERPDEGYETKNTWDIVSEGRDSKGDYIVNYNSKEHPEYKAAFHVQHTDQGRKVSIILGKNFPVEKEELHKDSDEYVNVMNLAKYWFKENKNLVHIYVFYANRTLDDMLEADNM